MRAGQRLDLVLLVAWGFCAVSAIFIGRTVRDTLFLAHESASRLPIMYIVSPAVVTIVGLVYVRIADRTSRDRLVPATALVFAAMILAIRVGLGPRWLYYALYAGTDCIGVLISMQFWLAAGERFTPREAKRQFGILAAGGTSATVVVGLAVTALVPRTGAENLLVGCAAFLVAVAVLAVTLARRPLGNVVAPTRPGRAPDPDETPPGASHLGLLGYLIAFAVVGVTLIDFQFKSIATEAYAGDRVGMVRFFGLLYVGTAAASLVIQLTLTRRIVAHLGVAGALLILPAALGLGALALLLVPSLAAATACKAADATLRVSINDAGLQLLYLPVPRAVRTRRKGRIDTLIKPATEGAVGLGLLAYRSTLGVRGPLAVAALFIIGAWIVMVLRMRGAYVRSLGETLRQRRISFDDNDTTSPGLAAEGARAIRDALASDDLATVQRGLDQVGQDAAQLADGLRALAIHPDATVRARALACLADGGVGLSDGALATALADPDGSVRAAGARIAGAANSAQLDTIAPLLGDSDPQLAAAAAEALYRYGDADRKAAVLDRVRALLADPSRRARRLGLAVATTLADPGLTDALLERLASPRDARTAAIALAAIGLSVEPALLAAIQSTDDARAVGALTALGRLATRDTPFEPLIAAITHDCEPRRDAAAAALARMRRTTPARTPPGEPILAACNAEITRAFTAMAASNGLGNAESVMHVDGTRAAVPYRPESVEGPAALISRALRERAERAQARLFDLLAALEPELDVPTARANLHDPDPVRRANAVELLDARVWPAAIAPLKQLALGMVDDASRAAKLAAFGKRLKLPRLTRDGWIDRLLNDPTPWMRACAAYYAGAARDAGSRANLVRLVNDADPLTAETARDALRRLDHPTERTPMLSTAEKILFLKGADLFAAIPGEHLAAIAAVSEQVTFEEGQVIFSTGDPGDALFLVVDGTVRITHGDRVLAQLGCREVLGEMALLDPAPRSATAIASAQVVLVRIGQDDFADVLAERPEVAAGVLRVLTRRLRAAIATEGSAPITAAATSPRQP